MADEIILTKLDDEADRIIDAFEERTGLEGEDDGEHRHYGLASDDHRIEFVHVLNDIDSDWPDHVGLKEPEG